MEVFQKLDLLNVRDHLPLKQGLRRLETHNIRSFFLRVRDHLPLKQGLRLYTFNALDTETIQSETIFH